MLPPGLFSVLFGTAVLMGALANFIRLGEIPTLLLEVAVGAVLLTTGWRAWREPGVASFATAVVTFLSAIFFAYRFLETGGNLIPGLMLLIGFLSLFAVVLGVFLEVQRDSSSPDS